MAHERHFRPDFGLGFQASCQAVAAGPSHALALVLLYFSFLTLVTGIRRLFSLTLSDTTFMSLTHEPASEPLHIAAK